jgi:hypothetical protein
MRGNKLPLKEVDWKHFLYDLLDSFGYPVFADAGSPSVGWSPKTFKGDKERPDLIFFHQGRLFFTDWTDRKRKPLPDPIGIEIKMATPFGNITSGIHKQLEGKYRQREYQCDDWTGTLPFCCLTTDSALLGNGIYGHLDHTVIHNADMATGVDFVLTRILWCKGMGVIIKIDGRFVISYQQYSHTNDMIYGQMIAMEDSA